MRILHVFWGFTGGGVDKVIEAYARMASVVPVDAQFVCLHGQDWGTNLAGLEAIGASSIAFSGRQDLSWIKRLTRHIDIACPEIVFAHGFNAPVAATLALRRTVHSPLLACSYHGSYHAPRPVRKPLEPIFNGVLHAIYRHRATGIVAVAEHSRRYLLERGVPEDRVVTIHNGLPARPNSAARPTRADFGLSAGDFIIGTASRLSPEKGLMHLLEAMPTVRASVPHAHLLILGRGPQEAELRARSSQLGLQDAVHFAGFQADSDAYLSLFDVFTLPSLAEYHSIALLEAMRAARPIVATTVGGNPESVSNMEEALLIPPSDPDTLAHALIQIANMPELAHRLAGAAKLRFDMRFSETVMLKRTHGWLQKLIANHSTLRD